jgi:hypothetical protein
MAIDSSIWIYQFQATMRDKEGQALINAHVLGFLRRISKLLFYGIKPVFVFDGGAPALKRTTLVCQYSGCWLMCLISSVERAQAEEKWCCSESCQSSRETSGSSNEEGGVERCPTSIVRRVSTLEE